jgi:hypothetical protein
MDKESKKATENKLPARNNLFIVAKGKPKKIMEVIGKDGVKIDEYDVNSNDKLPYQKVIERVEMENDI